MKNHIIEHGVGNIEGMGEDTFRKWMSGKRKATNNIRAGPMRGMQHFVAHHDTGDEGKDSLDGVGKISHD